MNQTLKLLCLIHIFRLLNPRINNIGFRKRSSGNFIQFILSIFHATQKDAIMILIHPVFILHQRTAGIAIIHHLGIVSTGIGPVDKTSGYNIVEAREILLLA